MDIALAILCAILILVGVLGSVLPVIPGPPIAWVGLLIIQFTSYAFESWRTVIIMGIAMVLIVIADFFIPIWGTKRFGGTKAGVRGSTVGMFVGLFFGPIGIILGPFVGAFIGEMIVNQKETKKALKSALGSFVGFLFGTGLKLVYGGFVIWLYFKAIL